MFFFLLWPLFARAPRHWFLENFLLSAPGVQSVFFFVALRWAPRPFGGARAKKKTPRVFFFFAPAPGKGRGRRSPVGRRHGARAKKNTTQGFFFAAALAKGKGRRSPVGSRHGARAKKKHHPGYFFLLRPRRKAREGEAPLGAGTGPEQKVFFFLLWPRAGAQRGFSFPCRSQGRSKKKHLGGVFFLLWPRAGAQRVLLPVPFAGAAAKKKIPWVVFLFAAAPRGRSLTHCGPGWRCLPLGGVVFFFLLRPRPDRGGVFFFCCGPARTLTHSRWAGAISARPGWCFFLLRPRRVFLDNNKKCLGYYIGSKKTRRGHSQKKKHHFRFGG